MERFTEVRTDQNWSAGFRSDFPSETLPIAEVQPTPDAGPILPLSAHTPPWEALQGKPCGQRRRSLRDHGVAGSASFEGRRELGGVVRKTGARKRWNMMSAFHRPSSTFKASSSSAVEHVCEEVWEVVTIVT